MKFIKNKKGSAFIESLLYTPIVIVLVLAIFTRIILLTQNSSYNNISRTILRECITCDSATASSSNEHNLIMVLNSNNQTKLFISEIRIINPLTNNLIESVEFPNRRLIDVSSNELKILNDDWNKGNVIEIDLYFSLSNYFSDDIFEMDTFGLTFNPIPNGSTITVRGVIENDIF